MTAAPPARPQATRARARTTAAPAARRRLGRDDRRAAILDAATIAFARCGYSLTSMADISGVAGVSHLIVYRHFDSKEVLYGAVLDQAVWRLEAALPADGAVGTHGVTPAALLAAARSDRAGFEVLWRHAPREPEFSRWADRARAGLLELTESALADLVGPGHRAWAARATVAYLVEAVLVWIEDGDPGYAERFVRATTAAMRAGVRSWVEV